MLLASADKNKSPGIASSSALLVQRLRIASTALIRLTLNQCRLLFNAVKHPKSSLHTVAWCTGGAQGYFQQAADAGADVYITGEISEAQYHLARETGTAFISAGHHATERYGVQALGNALAAEFGLAVRFFDEDNPA